MPKTVKVFNYSRLTKGTLVFTTHGAVSQKIIRAGTSDDYRRNRLKLPFPIGHVALYLGKEGHWLCEMGKTPQTAPLETWVHNKKRKFYCGAVVGMTEEKAHKVAHELFKGWKNKIQYDHKANIGIGFAKILKMLCPINKWRIKIDKWKNRMESKNRFNCVEYVGFAVESQGFKFYSDRTPSEMSPNRMAGSDIVKIIPQEELWTEIEVETIFDRLKSVFRR